jgi:hypothetical protein
MNTEKILSSKQIDPSKTILQITAEEALDSIKDMLLEFSLSIDLGKLSKDELEKLLSDYADAVVFYHPDDFHQERAVILKNETMLKKYGLTDDDIEILDFT